MTWGNNVLLRPADDGDIASEYICLHSWGRDERGLYNFPLTEGLPRGRI